MAWLLDLIRTSVKEYEPSDNARKMQQNSILDLRHDSGRYSAGGKDLCRELAVFCNEVEDFDYSEGDRKFLKMEIAKTYEISASEIVLGYDAVDFMRNFLFCLVEDKDEAVISMPCPSVYSELVKLYGGGCVCVPCGTDLHIRPELLFSACNSKTKLMLLNSPNYISGIPIDSHDISKLLSSIDALKMLLIIDESKNGFISVDHDFERSLFFKEHGKIVTIRSFADHWPARGCSLVYAILPAPLAREYDKIASIIYSPPSIAIKQAIYAMRDRSEKVRDIHPKITGEKSKMIARMTGMGLRPIDNNNSNIVFTIADADSIWRQLYEEGVLITNGSDNHLPGYLIMSPGSPKENEQFISVLGKVLNRVVR